MFPNTITPDSNPYSYEPKHTPEKLANPAPSSVPVSVSIKTVVTKGPPSYAVVGITISDNAKRPGSWNNSGYINASPIFSPIPGDNVKFPDQINLGNRKSKSDISEYISLIP